MWAEILDFPYFETKQEGGALPPPTKLYSKVESSCKVSILQRPSQFGILSI